MPVLSTNQREQVCKSCPIFKPTDQTCNSKLWINPDNDEVSVTAKAGFVRGCGCKMPFKWKNLSSHCIAGKF